MGSSRKTSSTHTGGLTDFSAATAFSTVQTLDYGGVQLIRRDMTEAIEACEENPAPQQVRFENEFRHLLFIVLQNWSVWCQNSKVMDQAASTGLIMSGIVVLGLLIVVCLMTFVPELFVEINKEYHPDEEKSANLSLWKIHEPTFSISYAFFNSNLLSSVAAVSNPLRCWRLKKEASNFSRIAFTSGRSCMFRNWWKKSVHRLTSHHLFKDPLGE